jgi:hypothetical protein
VAKAIESLGISDLRISDAIFLIRWTANLETMSGSRVCHNVNGALWVRAAAVLEFNDHLHDSME